MASTRVAVLLAAAALFLGACSSISAVPIVGGTATPEAEAAVSGRAPNEVLPSDLAAIAVISVSPIVPGRSASATMRYGTYQTCHAQVLFSDLTALPLGAYESGLGQTPTWRWEVPSNAPTTGTFTVACGVELFHVPFTAAGGTSVPVAPVSLQPAAVPWPTPLSCASTTKGCDSSYR